MYDILSQMLIVSVWEGTRRGGQLWGGREGRGTLEYPPSAFGLCLTSQLSPLSGEGQHQVQLFTSAAGESALKTQDYSPTRCNIARPFTAFSEQSDAAHFTNHKIQ